MHVINISYRLMPESARWLMAKGRMKEAEKIIIQVAQTNGTRVSYTQIVILSGLWLSDVVDMSVYSE